jgi:signal transduction histidine kinase
VSEPVPPKLSDIEAALRLFDESTGALSAQILRLEEVLLLKQEQLLTANSRLSDKVHELDRVTAWLNLVMGAVSSGVLAVDAQARITTCNAAAGALLRGMLSDPVGADYRSAFPDSPLLRVLDGNELVAGYERTVRGPDGDRRIIAAKSTALHAPDGEVIGAVEVFEDVTEVRRLRESVERADRLKQLGEMAAGVAHEIRNPLNGIAGFASLLTRDLPADDRRHRYASAIVEGVRTLNHTVTALLAFTSPKAPQRRMADPTALAQNCLELVQAELSLRADDGGRAVELSLVDHWGGTTLMIDDLQLRQALLNLVQNAVQAVQGKDGAHPQVRVTVSRHAEIEAVVIAVDDNGPGVPASERQRIFTPFYTTKDHGTGLGLAIVHSIVSLHGGTLAVEDGALGGACLRMIIPA